MGNKYGSADDVDRMGNNSNVNKAFENAARDAKLSEDEKRQLSKEIHELKNAEAGDLDYPKMRSMAEEIKKENS